MTTDTLDGMLLQWMACHLTGWHVTSVCNILFKCCKFSWVGVSSRNHTVFVLVQSNVTFSGCDIFHVFCMFCPCSVPFSGAASSLNGFWIHPVNRAAHAACCISCSVSEYIENAGNTSTECTGCSTGRPVQQHGPPRRLSVCPHPNV